MGGAAHKRSLLSAADSSSQSRAERQRDTDVQGETEGEGVALQKMNPEGHFPRAKPEPKLHD